MPSKKDKQGTNPVKRPVRLCVFCKHFEFDMGCPAWSDVTPGDTAVFIASAPDLEVERDLFRTALEEIKKGGPPGLLWEIADTALAKARSTFGAGWKSGSRPTGVLKLIPDA